jgi:hypothetical protein
MVRMKGAAKITGLIWMAACAALWLYMGFVTPENNCEGWGPGWLGPRMFCEAGFGIFMVPILLATPGLALWRWGSKKP